MIVFFEKNPAILHALHFGLSDEAAYESYTAQCAARSKGNDYEIAGWQYKATNRADAVMQHEDRFGVHAPLWAVVEVV